MLTTCQQLCWFKEKQKRVFNHKKVDNESINLAKFLRVLEQSRTRFCYVYFDLQIISDNLIWYLLYAFCEMTLYVQLLRRALSDGNLNERSDSKIFYLKRSMSQISRRILTGMGGLP